MGVRYLDYFFQQRLRYAHNKINIFDEINRWKSENDHYGPPIIIIQIWSLKIGNSGTKVEQIMGGRHQLQLQKFDNFFSQLTNCGVKLVFFENYISRSPRTNDEILHELDVGYSSGIDIFDTIEKHDGNTDFVTNGKDLVETRLYSGTSSESLKLVCSKYGTVKYYAGTNYNKEIVRFANENHALAIVTNNTDFIIFEGEWMVWSSKLLNLNDGTTKEYNRSQLLRALNLNSDQLPLLSTVSGNNVLSFEKLERFHRYLHLPKEVKKYFENLADYVRKLPQEIDRAVAKLSRDIFRSVDEHFQIIIRNSLSSYDTTLNITPDEEELETNLFLLKSRENRFICNIVTGRAILLRNQLIDLRRTDFMSYFDIIEPILRRKVGLLRKHKRTNLEYKQAVLTKIKHDEVYGEHNIIPTYPDKWELPDLLKLMYDENDDDHDLHGLRVELVKWLIFGDASTVEKIEKIPDDYLITILALKYLLQIDQVKPIEADAILLCVFDLHEEKIDENVCPKIATTRAIAVSNLYAKMHDQIRRCFEMVGLNKLIANNCSHDGPHFIFILNELLLKTDDDYANTVNVIQHLKCFLHF